MSYERNMLEMLAMPARQEVKNAIIETLFKHNGSIKEFAVGVVAMEKTITLTKELILSIAASVSGNLLAAMKLFT